MPDQDFDKYSKSYVDVVEGSFRFSGLSHSFFQQSKADKLARFVQQHFGGNKPALLDVGCGIGSLHPYIQPFYSNISGIDVSADSIKEAQDTQPQNTYLAYDGLTSPFDDDNFDMTLAVCVMHHVPPQNWVQFLSEKRRVVKPGGYVCLIEHNPINPATRLSVARCPFDADAVLLGAREMRRRLTDAGLRNVKSEHFVVFPTRNKTFQSLEAKLGRLPVGAQYMAWGQV